VAHPLKALGLAVLFVPLSTSAFLTQSCSVCGVQPILAALDVSAAQRDGCSLA